MAGKTYSAGTIFLQVVPVFKDVQDSIRRDVDGLEKSLGDDLEKAGRRAGERGGKAMGEGLEKHGKESAQRSATAFQSEFDKAVRGMQTSLKPIRLRFQTEDLAAEVVKIRTELAALGKVKINTDLDAEKAKAEIKALSARLKTLQDDAKLNAKLDIAGAVAACEAMEKRLDNLDKAAKIQLEIDRQQAERTLGAFERKVRETSKRAASSLGDSFNSELVKIRKKLNSLGDVRVDVDLTAEEFMAQLETIEARLRAIDGDSVSANVRVDIKTALAELEAFKKFAAADEITQVIDVEINERGIGSFERSVRAAAREAGDALGDGLNPEIDQIKARLRTLGDVNIDLDVNSANVRAEIDALAARLAQISASSPDIQVKADTGKAEAKLAAFAGVLSALDGRDIDIQVDVDAGAAIAKMGLLRSLMRGSSGDANSSANAFRAFNFVILAAATLIPALVPAIGALGGGLLALMPILAAVTAAFGAMLIGFSGIGGAVTALGEAEANAGKEAQQAAKQIKAASYAVADAKQALADAERSAAQASADAARAVADAREAAADAIEDALDRQKDAQEAYRDSVKDVRQAEEDLREARKRAAEELKRDKADTADKIRQNALDIREAQLAAFDATNEYNSVMANGASTAYDKEAAEVAMLQAQEALHELRDTQQELADDKKDQDKDGVKGNEDVENAQDALTAAIEAQQEAQEDLGDAAEAVAEARIQGAKDIADAVRNQQRTEAEGQRSIARAQEALRRAQESYGEALNQTSASADKVAEAMNKLGPAGQKFALFLNGLRDEFGAFRDAIQEAMLPGVQRALEGLINAYGPQFTAFMAEMGGVVGRFFEKFSESLQGPAWRRFFAIMGELGPMMAMQFGDTFINWMEVFANLMTAAAPFAERMSQAMLDFSEALSAATGSAEGQKQITEFMQYAADVGPKVIDFFGQFFDALINLGVALAPLGLLVMEGLTAFFDYISEMDPDKLGLIAGAFIGLVVASQLAYGAVALVAAGGAIFASTIGLVIFAVVAIIAAIAILAIKFPAVREILQKSLEAIGKGFRWLQDEVIEPVVEWIVANWPKMMTAMKKAWERDLKPVFKAIGDTLVQLYEDVIVPVLALLLDAWKTAFKAMVIVWNEILWPLLRDIIFPLIRFMWTEVFQPALSNIMRMWGRVFRVMRTIWNTVLSPVILAILKIVGRVFGKVVIPLVRTIGRVWATVFRAMKGAWSNVLYPILDLFGKIISKLWTKFAKPAIEGIQLAWSVFATAFKLVYDNTIGKIVSKFIEAMGGKQGLQSKFETVVGALKTAWEGLKEIFAAPIRFLLETVLNDGAIAGFNKIANFVGSTPIKPITIPDILQKKATGGTLDFGDRAFRTGGTLPGYTPGRDPHKFVSPTGGRLELSGGEAIMRPEFTAAVGTGFVDTMNAAARSGGIGAVRKRIGALFAGDLGVDRAGRPAKLAFASGGVLKTEDILRAQAYAKSKDYASYSQAARLGPDSFDCSGFMSVLTNIIRGAANPASSLGTTATFPWTGFSKGPGQFTIGSSNPYPGSSGGHMAGTLGGLNVESRGGEGVVIGPSARGYNDSGFNEIYHLGASVGTTIQGGKVSASGGIHFPGWVVDIAKDPLGYVKGLITGPINKLTDKFGDNGMVKLMTSMPGKFVGAMKDKIVDFLPGPVKDIAGGIKGAVDGAGNAIGAGLDFVGLAKGGVIGRDTAMPYNGTMMYDAGGYLPPGLTTVMNLTGKPEPVFTDDQFKGMTPGKGGGLHYEPHFNGSDLGPEDVADDLEFAFRKMGRTGGKYEGIR